jgi:hypothetical protein
VGFDSDGNVDSGLRFASDFGFDSDNSNDPRPF